MPTLSYQTEQKPVITRKWFFISNWKMAGMLLNKLKNLFNLDFQLNNCCIVMEAIYQNLKDPPPYLLVRDIEQCRYNGKTLTRSATFYHLSQEIEQLKWETFTQQWYETPGNLWIWTHSLQLLLSSQLTVATFKISQACRQAGEWLVVVGPVISL